LQQRAILHNAATRASWRVPETALAQNLGMSGGPLPHALSGERHAFSSPAGPLSAYLAGHGKPLLLVHSVNAAASAAQVRPLHEHCAASRSVFSIDLPGYGFSDRSDRAYTPRLMTDALHAAVWPVPRWNRRPRSAAWPL